MPKTALLTVARQLRCPIPPKTALPEMILQLASHICGDLSEEEQLNILRCRLPKHSAVDDMMESLDVDEVLDKVDAQAVSKDKAERSQVHEEFAASVKTLATKVRSKLTASGSGSAASSADPRPKRQRRYPKQCEITDQTSVDTLNSFLPTGCHFYVDKIDAYWRLAAWGTRYGRSWALHGVAQGANQLLKLAWKRAVEEGREDSCPWPELLEG